MAIAAGRHEIGPANGSLHLRTTREGLAAKVGHDLLLKVGRWSGSVDVPDPADPGSAGLSVRIEMNSLEVVEGTGGASPLDAGDRTDILRNAAKTLDVEHFPTATFTASAVRPASGGAEIDGQLDLVGGSGNLTLTIAEVGETGWRATGTVVQSQFGIKPYKAFLGALRLSDPVTVEAEISLAEG